MIRESFRHKDEANKKKDPSRGLTLIVLSIATSIDAAAAGFSFAALKTPIIVPSIIIGLICMIFSATGLFLGNKIGSKFGGWAERIGGIILICIGIKILLDHTV
jgi:putative Mn2+ efflux pump MntP